MSPLSDTCDWCVRARAKPALAAPCARDPREPTASDSRAAGAVGIRPRGESCRRAPASSHAAARDRRDRARRASSTGSRCTPISTRRASCSRAPPRCTRSRTRRSELQARIAAADTRRTAPARGTPARAREAERAALHRARHRRLAPQEALASVRMGDVEVVARQIGRTPRAFKRVAVRCPFGKPAVTEQAAVRRRRPPVPDAVLRHVPVPRRSDLAARGRRRRRALDTRGRGRPRARCAASTRRRRSSGGSGPSSTPASAARRAPAASSACTRTPRSRSRGPATSSATASLAELPVPLARVLLYSVTWTLDLARHQWQDGIRRVESMRGDRRRYADRMAQVDVLVNALRQRVGQVFTLDELAESYDGADDWARACSTTPTRGAAGAERAGHGRRRRVPPLRPRRDGLPAVRRVVLIVVGAVLVFAVGIAVGEALHDNPKPGGHPVARPDAAAAAARAGRARNGHRYRSEPINRFRKTEALATFGR